MDFANDVFEYQVQLFMDYKAGKITHEQGLLLLKQKYPTVISDSEEDISD